MIVTSDAIVEALVASAAPYRRSGELDDYDGSYHASSGVTAERIAGSDVLIGGRGDSFYDLRLSLPELDRQFRKLAARDMVLTIDKAHDGSLVVEDKTLPGSPKVGRGETIVEAIGNWLISYQEELGIRFELTPKAQPAEDARRAAELATR